MNKACWALLLHLGYNMWKEKDALYTDEDLEYVNASDKLICDISIWNEITGMMPESGIDTLVIDIGGGDSVPKSSRDSYRGFVACRKIQRRAYKNKKSWYNTHTEIKLLDLP